MSYPRGYQGGWRELRTSCSPMGKSKLVLITSCKCVEFSLDFRVVVNSLPFSPHFLLVIGEQLYSLFGSMGESLSS